MMHCGIRKAMSSPPEREVPRTLAYRRRIFEISVTLYTYPYQVYSAGEGQFRPSNRMPELNIRILREGMSAST